MAIRALAREKKTVKIVKVVKKAKPEKAKSKKVAFAYFAPEARQAFVAGSFNGWQESGLALKKDEKGYWKASVALGEGRYEYRYIVDGAWANDQEKPECVPNAFGTWNSVVEVKA